MLSPSLHMSFVVLLLVFTWWTLIAAVVILRSAAKNRSDASKYRWWWLVVAFPGISWLFGSIFFIAYRKDRRVWVPVLLYAVLLAGGLAASLQVIGRAPEVTVGRPKPFVREWRLGPNLTRRTPGADPRLCMAMSGGGIRSAAFNMGVLRGLHELNLLQQTDVISAVSGGTYTLSWLVLQPYYAAAGKPQSPKEMSERLAQMFDPEGPFQRALERKSNLAPAVQVTAMGLVGATLYQTVRALSWSDPTGSNLFGMRMMYRGNIQAAFHATPAEDNFRREAEQTTTFWLVNDVPLPSLETFLAGGGLPFPVFNTTLRVDGAHRKTMWASVFEITPLGMGADSYGFAAWSEPRFAGDDFRAVRSANLAPAISGAALSSALQPTSDRLRRAVDYLNLDLGYYVPGFDVADAPPIYLSDGGHSENLGVYSLIRRRCGAIIVVDAEDEPCARLNVAEVAYNEDCLSADRPIRYRFESLKTLEEALPREKELATTLELNRASFDPRRPILVGKVSYTGAAMRTEPNLLYVKLALDRSRLDEYPDGAAALKAYARAAPVFPHDSTTNQRFSGAQFAAYRDLGYWVVIENRSVVERHGRDLK